MGEATDDKPTAALADYRVRLPRAGVLHLREQAVRETRRRGRVVTWVELLREWVAVQAGEGGQCA